MRTMLSGVALYLMACCSAFALDWTQPITDEKGKQMEYEKGVPLTLQNLSVRALLLPIPVTPGGKEETGDQKVTRAILATKIQNDPKASLTTEEITTVKNAVARIGGPMMVYRAWSLLDPTSVSAKSTPPEEAKKEEAPPSQ